MKKILILGFIIVSPLYTIDLINLHKEKNETIFTPPDKILALYQLIKDVHELFVLYNIEYWIQGGTLVGSLRHKGLIPWDDDFDINIKATDATTVHTLEPLLNELGYVLYSEPNIPLIKIILKERFIGKAPFLDIFLTYHDENKTLYVSHWWQREGKPIYLYDHELYPLTLYPFGELMLYGPKDPFVYLSCGFGDNYMEKVVIYNHSMFDHKIPSIYCDFQDIPEQCKGPAQPIGPLKNRIENLKKTRPHLFPSLY